MHEDRRNVDAHRADVEAGTAQGGGVRQRGVVLDPGQLRAEYGADGTGIDAAVRVPAGAFIDGAHVEARGTADAVQRRAACLVGEYGRATVVEQYEMEVLGAV